MAGDVTIITVAPGGFQYCEGQTEHVDSMNPAELVAKLQELFPKATEAIEQREETLADRYNPA